MNGLHRRDLLGRSLALAGLLGTLPLQALSAPGVAVRNVTGLYTVEVARIATPKTTDDIVRALADWPGRVCIGGGRYSMGGQVGLVGGLQLDMRGMNRLLWLDAPARKARVQAGMRWRDLQDHLDPQGLAVKTMQSYANFSIGGAVSVNAHGRYVGHGPVGHSVRALQLVLADGRVVEASRSERAELFAAAIGGYGAVGVITEVELELAANVHIERSYTPMALDAYADHFRQRVQGDPTAVLHNADLLPPAFDQPHAVTWRRCSVEKPLTDATRLVPRQQSYAKERRMIRLLTETPGGAALRRSVVHPLLNRSPAVQWLNHEASRDVAELEPESRSASTYVLQEYFVPVRHFLGFARAMAAELQRANVQALNISIRHSPADRVSALPWAREEVFCFVLYYRQGTGVEAQTAVGVWTRALIELALKHEGRYYLPYQLHAEPRQFNAAYPEAVALRRLKAEVDPRGRFSNEMWRRYLDA